MTGDIGGMVQPSGRGAGTSLTCLNTRSFFLNSSICGAPGIDRADSRDRSRLAGLNCGKGEPRAKALKSSIHCDREPSHH